MSRAGRGRNWDAAQRKVAAWVANGAVPFFTLAILARDKGNRATMRADALTGARILKSLRAFQASQVVSSSRVKRGQYLMPFMEGTR